MALIACPNCGNPISDKSQKCIRCGFNFSANEKKNCTECGNEVPIDATVCPVCGFPFEATNTPINIVSTKNKKPIQLIVISAVAGALLALAIMFLCTNVITAKEEAVSTTEKQIEDMMASEMPTTKEAENVEINGDIYKKSMPVSKKEVLANIDVQLKKAKNGEYVAFITNNNCFVIPELEIEITFYLKGNLVDTAQDGHDVILPNYTVVSSFGTYEDYDDVKYNISVEWGNDYINHSENVGIEYNLNSSKDVLVSISNNGSVDIREIEIIAVFYDQNNELLGVSSSCNIYDVGAEKTENKKLTLIGYELKPEIDHAEVYMNQAHTFFSIIDP